MERKPPLLMHSKPTKSQHSPSRNRSSWSGGGSPANQAVRLQSVSTAQTQWPCQGWETRCWPGRERPCCAAARRCKHRRKPRLSHLLATTCLQALAPKSDPPSRRRKSRRTGGYEGSPGRAQTSGGGWRRPALAGEAHGRERVRAAGRRGAVHLGGSMCEASNEIRHSTTLSYLGIVTTIRCGALQAASGATLRSGGSGVGGTQT